MVKYKVTIGQTEADSVNDFFSCRKRGLEAMLDEKYKEAIAEFERAVDKTEKSEEKVGLYNRIIECYKELMYDADEEKEGYIKRITDCYENILKLDSKADNYKAYIHFLGEELVFDYGIDRTKEALALAKRAEELYPDDAELYAEMYMLNTLDDKESAYNMLIKACKLRYNDAKFLINTFGPDLFKPKPNSIDIYTAPFYVLLDYRGGALKSNVPFLLEMCNYIVENIKGHSGYALFLAKLAYQNEPNYKGLKELLVKAYIKAIMEQRNNNRKEALKEEFERFCQNHKLINPLVRNKTKENKAAEIFVPSRKIRTPKEIKAYLDDYIIGQEQAKIIVSVGLYNHLLRMNNDSDSDIELKKSNILLLGPTGCGKTYIGQTLAKIAGVPFVIFDASKITSAGYVGANAEDCILALYRAANNDIKKTEFGIVYLDEVDKIAASYTHGKDVGGAGAQEQLMKILEGSKVPVSIGEGPIKTQIFIDTTNILFILGGAFSGNLEKKALDGIISERYGKKKLGFRTSEEEIKKNPLQMLEDKDLQAYGFLPEFAGRVPLRAVLDPLSKEELRRILTEPKDALIKQYKELFRLSGIELNIEDKVLEIIAEEAFNLKAGARSLRTICERLFIPLQFELTGADKKSVNIDEAYAKKILYGP